MDAVTLLICLLIEHKCECDTKYWVESLSSVSFRVELAITEVNSKSKSPARGTIVGSQVGKDAFGSIRWNVGKLTHQPFCIMRARDWPLILLSGCPLTLGGWWAHPTTRVARPSWLSGKEMGFLHCIYLWNALPSDTGKMEAKCSYCTSIMSLQIVLLIKRSCLLGEKGMVIC